MSINGMQRISKLMAQRGMCSRREADEYIRLGLVSLDGTPVTELGTKAWPTQTITLAKEALKQQGNRITIILNKPIGYVSHSVTKAYKPAASLVTRNNYYSSKKSKTSLPKFPIRGLAPAGRLDIESQGLLVLTQDGRIAKTLIGNNSIIEREYLVRVEGSLRKNGLQLLNHGLLLDGKPLKKARVGWQNNDQLKFILTEGKKRQIRRMCELVGLRVTGLKRVRIGRIKLGDLPEGKWRILNDNEHF